MSNGINANRIIEDRYLRYDRPLSLAYGGMLAAVKKVCASSTFSSMVVPGMSLLALNTALYSGIASFALRPNVDKRMLPISGIFIFGVFLGGLYFPRLLAWTNRTGSTARRVVLGMWLVGALTAVLPGFSQYVFNEPLRILANLLFGTMVAPVYHLFFSRFTSAWRGTCFGASLGGGLLCWHVLLYLSHSWPAEAAGFHPFLLPVYYIHVASLAALTVSCVAALAIRQAVAHPEPDVNADATGRIALNRKTLFYAAFAVYALSGVLDAKLTPVIPADPNTASVVWPILFSVVAATAAGWLLDRRLDLLFRYIMPVCYWFFILTPALAVFGYKHELYGLLRTAAAVAQFVFFVIASVAVAKLTPTIGLAVFYACSISAIRILSIAGHILWTRMLQVGPGYTVLATVILAFLIANLFRRLDFSKPSSPPSARITGNVPQRAAAFVAKFDLTPRESETAILLLAGGPIRDIAVAMGISESTAKKHIANVYRKMGVVNRPALHVLFQADMGETVPQKPDTNKP